MAGLAALCKPHEQKLSTPVHSTLLYDFDAPRSNHLHNKPESFFKYFVKNKIW